LEVNARLMDQVAKVQVSQTFVNTGSRQMEVAFIFPLPYDGAIDQLTLLVDGKEFPAKLLSAKDARSQYEAIVRKNQDPALLEWIGTGMFKTSVFPVPAGAERTVTLQYSQLLRKQQGLTDFLFPLSTAKYTSEPVESVKFNLSIQSTVDIKNVYSPSHKVEIKRPSNQNATISYEGKNEVPANDFRLLFDVGEGQVGTSVLSYHPSSEEEGYLLLLSSPEIKSGAKELPKKNVLLVMDRSGSMSGKKLEQAKGALKFMLNNLQKDDTFNIVVYDSEVELWKPELQRYNDETRNEALGFVEGIYAGGSTNISGALTGALSQLKDNSRTSYVLFFTDGLPTAGETNEAKIVEGAKQSNHVRARIFAFGVGYDLNSRLLDRLVRENHGQSEFVRPNDDIEATASALFRRIAAPVLTNLQIKFDVEGSKPEEGSIINRQYPKEVTDLFAGEQLVIVARYKKSGDAKVTITGKVGEDQQTFNFPAKLVAKSDDQTNVFVEKLWALRRIGEIIDELDLKGKNEELIKELVSLSTKHGILTPYTSFLADENSQRDLASQVREANDRLDTFAKDLSGERGISSRINKGNLQRADQALDKADAAFEGSYDPAEIAASAAPSSSSSQPRAYGRNVSAAPASGPGVASAPAVKTEAERARVAQNVQNIGNRSFYKRANRWVEAGINEDQEKKAQRIKRFSDEYFKLVEKHGKAVAPFLVMDEPVVLTVEGQTYEFD
ncbi:MAG: VIT domain-containing protein, partial [Planctomycetota bacterium]|nr:VIT domain-containing protein [Planctomycetota bacterium]